MGFEPTTHGTTIRYSNQLSYTHHLFRFTEIGCKNRTFFRNGSVFSTKFSFFPFFNPKSGQKPYL